MIHASLVGVSVPTKKQHGRSKWMSSLPSHPQAHLSLTRAQIKAKYIYLRSDQYRHQGKDGPVEGRDHEGKELRKRGFHPMQGTLTALHLDPVTGPYSCPALPYP